MNRLRTIAAMAALVIILAACGPAASSGSDEPSGRASVAASEPQASDGGTGPSFSEGVVAELEVLIPGTIGGVTMKKSSSQGNEFLVAAGSDPAIVKFLEDLGVSPSDVSMASGYGLSADFVGVVMFVFRAAGADSARLVAAFKEAIDTERDAPLVWSDATVGGKQVETAQDSERGGQTAYLYAVSDVLFFLAASDPAAAAGVFTGLS